MENTKTESASSASNQKLTCPLSPPSSPTTAASERFSASFAAMYHSIFPPKPDASPPPPPPPPLPFSLSLSPSTATSPSSASASPPFSSGAESQLLQARLILEYQELADHYESSLCRLQALADELVCLRAENAELKLANSELVRLLTLSPPLPSRSSATGRLAPVKTTAGNSNSNVIDIVDEEERISMPKSISVRSSGYWKMHQLQGNTAASGSGSNRSRAANQLDIPDSLEVQRRVSVPARGGGRDDQLGPPRVEFEVYNQGMRKTELCNKWQETGSCPYGDHCQFAHGITELRPVIRHPRYKTQVCRMVLAGDICPYGHRCHFRHSLTEQERLLAPR